MKIAGVIAEYNPFHNGHAHHLKETRRMGNCDYVVVCMDGSFTQRGEPACMDKWARARIALRCGADAVFELPALWALQPADGFARGGVAVLGGLGCDLLSFGSEETDINLLKNLAEVGENEPPELRAALRRGLEAGKSHARARGEALSMLLGVDAEKLNSPNLILATQYLREIGAQNLKMEALPIARIGNYHDAALGDFASATAIRAAISDGKMEEALACVPEPAREALCWAGDLHGMDDLLLHTLRGMPPEEIAELPGVGEGLEQRIMRCAAEASCREELLEMLKCKRYTRARLSRICACALLKLTKSMVESHAMPEYARLIGMREDARPLLRELKARSRLPIVSDAAQLRGDAVFDLERRATDLRALLCNDPAARRAGQEFTRKFVRV
ncbi:MAG: nucleotidyltransferase family protein [Eubacteriales bacterium]|nr:nucleotidyltransferase family protein [Eubacteriales bacterium]